MFDVKIIQFFFRDILFCVFPGRQISLKTFMHDNQFEIQQTQNIITISDDLLSLKFVKGYIVLYILIIVFKFKTYYFISILHSHKRHLIIVYRHT